MIKRQQRLQRIANVAQEYLAARTAAEWLQGCQETDPSFGNQYGWEAKAGIAFCENMEATYIVRMYAEFEAGLRDYWKTHLKRDTHPNMVQLVRHAIPNQMFSQDTMQSRWRQDRRILFACPVPIFAGLVERQLQRYEKEHPNQDPSGTGEVGGEQEQT